MLYRLQPDARGRALGCICSLSDKLRNRTLKVHSQTQTQTHTHTNTNTHTRVFMCLVLTCSCLPPPSPCPDVCRSAFSAAEW